MTVDLAGFRPGGTLRATITCTAAMSDLWLLLVPGSQALTASFASVVDTVTVTADTVTVTVSAVSTTQFLRLFGIPAIHVTGSATATAETGVTGPAAGAGP